MARLSSRVVAMSPLTASARVTASSQTAQSSHRAPTPAAGHSRARDAPGGVVPRPTATATRNATAKRCWVRQLDPRLDHRAPLKAPGRHRSPAHSLGHDGGFRTCSVRTRPNA